MREFARIWKLARCRCTAFVALLVAATACDGGSQTARARAAESAAKHDRTVVIAAPSEPTSLLPVFAVDLLAGQICNLIYQRLAEPIPGFAAVGDMDYRPALATRWTWGADSLSLRFTLDSTAHWHDGRSVTSRDVQFTFSLWTDSTVMTHRAPLVNVVDSVTTPDTRVAVVWSRRRAPALFHEVTYHAQILPAHILDTIPRAALLTHAINRHPIGSGAFRFVRWTAGAHLVLENPREAAIVMRRVTDRAAPTPPSAQTMAVRRVIVSFVPNYTAAIMALSLGEVDIVDFVRPADAARLARSPHLAIARLPGYSYAFLQFNLRARRDTGTGDQGLHPLFGNVALRRALAMAIDREALVRNLLDSLGWVGLGPVTRAQATADTTLTAPPFAPARARALLDSLGWHVASDGIRRRSGRRLSFAILVPSSSATRVQAAVVLQAMLAAVGVDVRVEQLDQATAIAALERGRFDAALSALRADPAPASVRDAWGGAGAVSGAGFNYGHYVSAAADRLFDSADVAANPAGARALYRRAYQQVVDDVPAVFLYEPAALVAYNRRLHPVAMRADAWWASVAQWTVE